MVDAASPALIEAQPLDDAADPTGLHVQADAYRVELAATFKTLERSSGHVAAAFEADASGDALTGAVSVFERERTPECRDSAKMAFIRQ